MNNRVFKRVASALAAMLLLTTTGLAAYPRLVSAEVNNPTPTAKVSFTFDDGLTTAVTQAAPTLAKYGLTGTDYVITGCVGMTTSPNTCHANTDTTYMTWAQIAKLQTTYGWEIGSHSATHPYLATKDATDGQPNVLTPAQVTKELTDSRTALAAHGITATDFSTPYGDYNNAVLAQIAKYYASHRGFADNRNNDWPNNDYLIYDMPVQSGVSVAQVEARIDSAIANNQWLVLTMHNVKTNASTNPDDYEYDTAKLDKIAAYVKTKQTSGLIRSVNVSKGLVTSTANLLPNSSFDSGLAGGWTTDNATAVRADSGNNGSYPSPTNSIKIVANGVPARLYSPHVSVDPNTTYMLKNFLNVQSLTSGDVEFYIDEYDVNGNWISGQYKKTEASSFVENLNMTYKPTSAAVSTADLQITVTANSGITAYLDNIQWFALSTTTPPTQTNLVANGTFDSGISLGWTTDNSAGIVADSASHGSPSNPVNSVHAAATSRDTHLFSPAVTVTSAKTYTMSTWVNTVALNSGEVGFYVDEYDAAGNWISGQYKTGFRSTGTANVSFNYTPSSANVAKASLQVIFQANSGIAAYVDDVRWYQN